MILSNRLTWMSEADGVGDGIVMVNSAAKKKKKKKKKKEEEEEEEEEPVVRVD